MNASSVMFVFFVPEVIQVLHVSYVLFKYTACDFCVFCAMRAFEENKVQSRLEVIQVLCVFYVLLDEFNQQSALVLSVSSVLLGKYKLCDVCVFCVFQSRELLLRLHFLIIDNTTLSPNC